MIDFVFANIAPVIGFGIALVFIADLIGNTIAFGNRRFNAIVSAVIWGIVFYVIVFFGQKELDMKPIEYQQLLALTVLGLQSVFVADVIGNSLVFDNRVVNAIVTSIIWAVVFMGTIYALKYGIT